MLATPGMVDVNTFQDATHGKPLLLRYEQGLMFGSWERTIIKADDQPLEFSPWVPDRRREGKSRHCSCLHGNTSADECCAVCGYRREWDDVLCISTHVQHVYTQRNDQRIAKLALVAFFANECSDEDSAVASRARRHRSW